MSKVFDGNSIVDEYLKNSGVLVKSICGNIVPIFAKSVKIIGEAPSGISQK